MKDSVLQRIAKYCNEFNLSNNKLSGMIGIGQKTVNNYMNGSRKVSYEFIEAIIRTFEDISSDWLITGKGEMLKKEQSNTGGSNISGSNNASIENSGNFGSVGGNIVSNHINVSGKEGVDQKIIEPDGRVTIDIKGSKELELMQAKLSAAEDRITMLEELLKERDCTIERQNRVIDKLIT